MINLLTNGVLTTGKVVAVEELRHGRFGKAYVAVFECLGPEDKTVAGKYTTFSSSVGCILQNYHAHQIQLHFLYDPKNTATAVPIMLRAKPREIPTYYNAV